MKRKIFVVFTVFKNFNSQQLDRFKRTLRVNYEVSIFFLSLFQLMIVHAPRERDKIQLEISLK